MRLAVVLLSVLFLTGCGLFHRKPPRTFTSAPSIGTAQRGVSDAKDFVGRARRSNINIEKELDQLEKDLQK
jgi:hypothetical protein